MDAQPKIPFNERTATLAVLRVGDGRGFVVEGARGRYIITAAHCLPSFPPAASFSHTEERTYRSLVGPIESEPSVCVECMFVDPIADIAVLGSPDNQGLPKQADEYEAFLEGMSSLTIAEAPRQIRGWLLSLDCKWFSCKVQHVGGPLWTTQASLGIRGGMSGSPILSDDGRAVGIILSGGGTELEDDAPTEGGPEPWLVGNLPGWLLREIAVVG